MPFEDQLGDSLRRTGDSFHLDDRPALIAGGLRRGRRTVRRRRTAAVTGSVVALALVGLGGAYADGLLGGGGAQEASVAAPAKPTPLAGKDQDGEFTADQMVTILKSLLPGGKLTRTEGRGTGGHIPPLAYGVYDDGKGEGAISLVVDRIDPSMVPELKKSQGCASGAQGGQDSCTTETLHDGSWLKIYKGYEYPDHRAETKDWTASLITPQGYRVDVSEWNAAAEKDAPISRDEPPLSSARLKALVTAKEWKPVLAALEPAGKPASEGTPKRARRIRPPRLSRRRCSCRCPRTSRCWTAAARTVTPSPWSTTEGGGASSRSMSSGTCPTSRPGETPRRSPTAPCWG